MFRLGLTGLLLAGACAMGAQADVIDGEDLQDPTRPLVRPSAIRTDDDGFLERLGNILPGSFELSFVRASSSSPMAVINDRQLTIGDVIGGAELIAIDRSGVTLLMNGEETRINLYSSSVKAAARTQ
ncbi:MAG: hypothetical protein RL120_12820 [Gammaproteobacteria bacterium]